MQVLNFIRQPWPWYVAGPLIGLTVPALLLLGNKAFGISSSLRHLCAACLPANVPFFQYDWKRESWNLFFVAGVTLGGLLATQFLANPAALVIDPDTVQALRELGIREFSGLMPPDMFNAATLLSGNGLVLFVGGGFLVGFGTRWAGGCTSGHTITGLANLQWPSLVATVSFFIGGLVMTHWLLPHLFSFQP